MKNRLFVALGLSVTLLVNTPFISGADKQIEISGRYPHLAMFNHNGECGTGAVVPWADRLWVITYAPHATSGSDDRLYEIDSDLKQVIRPESVGGTPADRMIHKESKQLVIGSYFIDEKRNVRAISPKVMPGRLTAAARHLTDPAGKVYILDMEGILYEVDVHSLEVNRLFARVAPGAHGKGAYTSQGRLVTSNNGARIENPVEPTATQPPYDTGPEASGVLAEWDGKDWRILESRQFTEVTGPGGIEGAPSDDAPIWAVGWDKRSVILKVLDGGKWSTLRLPKADDSYDGKHGWHTEWPRIREVGEGRFLMNMHGSWFHFPKTMSASNSGGLRPIGSYLKITGDFANWKDRIVFGCDDLAVSDFGGGNAQPAGGQSQSNLWFTRWEDLPKNGSPFGTGAVWINDPVKANEPSVPYLFAGYAGRTVHMAHDSDAAVTFTLETSSGDGKWTEGKAFTVGASGYAFHVFPDSDKSADGAQWIRVKTDSDCPSATVAFTYGTSRGAVTDREKFAALADAGGTDPGRRGNVVALGGDAKTLLFTPEGTGSKPLEVDEKMQFKEFNKEAKPEKARKGTTEITSDDASVVVVQAGKRYRLPKSAPAFDEPGAVAPRIREVVTERSLLNAHGTLYVLPRAISGGMPHLKPICTHDKLIDDFCSYRGLLVLTGTRKDAKPDGHFFGTDDGRQGLWFGDIDDLWKLGKPRGHGGPLLKTSVHANQPSDAYLMTGYDKKSVSLSHDSPDPVRFTIEVDFLADDKWHAYQTIEVPAGETVTHQFPPGYSARWVRVRSDKDCKATAQFTYE